MNDPAAPAPIPAWNRRGTALLTCAAICAALTLAYAGSAWAMLVYRLLTDGVLALLWLAAACGLGSFVPLPTRAADALPLRIVTRVALGLGAISFLTLVLGLTGAMSQFVAWALLAAGVAMCIIRALPKRETAALSLQVWWGGRAASAWLWALATPFFAMTLVAAFVPPGVLWGDEPNGYDVVEYHLQVPREWYESGRIEGLRHNVFSYFPFNVEMQFLLAMHVRGGPWAGMYLAQLMHVGYVALSVAAVYAVARSFGGNATLAGVCAASTPWLALLAPVAYNEGGLLLYGTLAVGWTLHALRDHDRRIAAMAVAGAMAGLACGVKLTAVPMLLLPLPAAFVAIAAARRERIRRAVLASALFVATGTVLFSPWLLKNALWTGNPVFPEAQELFGRGHFTEAQSQRWTAAHSPRADQQPLTARFEAAWEQIGRDARYGYLLLPLALTCGIATWRHPQTWLLLALLVVWLAIWSGFTHLQGRFFVLAIPFAALLVAQVSGRAAIAAGGVSIAFAVVGFIVIHARTTLWLHEKGVAVALGVESLSEFMTPTAARDVSADTTLALVGDAKAFCYQRPMSRLRYATVFDVSGTEGTLVDAWISVSQERMAVLIDPAELERFARTYRNLPPVPREVLQRREPFVVTDDEFLAE